MIATKQAKKLTIIQKSKLQKEYVNPIVTKVDTTRLVFTHENQISNERELVAVWYSDIDTINLKY